MSTAEIKAFNEANKTIEKYLKNLIDLAEWQRNELNKLKQEIDRVKTFLETKNEL